jgi:mRNA interferase RelE/StbE
VSYQISVSTAAERQLLKLPGNIQQRIEPAIDQLANDPRPPGCVKLAGEDGLWRIRVGDYRIVYTVKDKQLIVLVVRIAHRRDVYRG